MFETKRILAVLSLLTILFALPPTAAADDDEIQEYVGSWRCGNDALVTANEGGTFTVSVPDRTLSTKHGVWERTGPATIDTTDETFVYDDDGNLVNILLSQSATTVDGDTFTADLLITVFDLDGVQLDQFEAFVSCSRIQVLPLPGAPGGGDDSDSD